MATRVTTLPFNKGTQMGELDGYGIDQFNNLARIQMDCRYIWQRKAAESYHASFD